MSEDLHPELTPDARRRLFQRGVELFNDGRFFDSHEEWETIWRSTTPEPRDLFQGLIQVAAGMHHWVDRGKPAPAARVMARGRRRLEPFAPTAHGVDLAALVASVRRWEAWLEDVAGGLAPDDPPPVPRINPARPRSSTPAAGSPPRRG